MNYYVNGEKISSQSSTLEELIKEKNVDFDQVLVEMNQKIVRRENWAETMLSENDCIEIVTFVGGG